MKTPPHIEERPLPGSRSFYIVENHHEVLLPWLWVRRKLEQPPVILTLDYHTDTLGAFTAAARAGHIIPTMELVPSDSKIAADIALLHHDEHLDYAYRSGLAKRCIVLSHTPQIGPLPDGLSVIHDPNTPPYPNFAGEDMDYRVYSKAILTDAFLSPRLKLANFTFEEPFILDIDLDYFQTLPATTAEHLKLFRQLCRQAAAVTVSRESIWLQLLRLSDETITPNSLLELIHSQF